MIISRRLVLAGGASTVALAASSPLLAADKGLIAIITPSHDNPFFKAEADGAKARG